MKRNLKKIVKLDHSREDFEKLGNLPKTFGKNLDKSTVLQSPLTIIYEISI